MILPTTSTQDDDSFRDAIKAYRIIKKIACLGYLGVEREEVLIDAAAVLKAVAEECFSDNFETITTRMA
jgi:hypothetical protein